MPLVQTRGAASAQGFGEFAQASAPIYIEDVFSTYLYEGNSSTQTIINGVDLLNKGGLVWAKSRNTANSHLLVDTVRGFNSELFSNATSAASTVGSDYTSWNTNGYSLGFINGNENVSGRNFVSWTFREQPKFFDIVTYTGTGSNRTIAHSLGSVPGSIIVKRTDTTAAWAVYHRSLANTQYLVLNDTAAAATGATWWNSTTPTSAVFSVGTDASVNASGGTYVAYLFAHDAGGFGLTGTDNVISCGSFTTNGSGNATVSLGYEPQWLMFKASTITQDWYILDSMRGMTSGGIEQTLRPNTSGAEDNWWNGAFRPTATGFSVNGFDASTTWIYIACRRGPMKVPTLGTSVFQPVTYSGNGSNDRLVNTTITPDLFIDMRRENIMPRYVLDRLRGNAQLYSNLANAESTNTAQVPTNTFNVNQTGITVSADEVNASGRTFVIEAFRRAPSFFDEVCYTGTGVATTVAHNLAAVPELMIIKQRSSTNSGVVYTASGGTGVYLRLFDSSSSDSGNTPTTGDEIWNSTTPTSSVFSVNASARVNGNASTYVAYLFATCAGVSKVGSYTGTGATQTINCGFTGGARFVLIKKSTQTAPDRDWYVWDTARGMVSGTDPSLKLNTNAAEVNANDVYTISTGFQLVSSSDYVNASGVTYIFLAIA